MASVVVVKDTDRGWNRIKRDMREMKGHTVAVGVLGKDDERFDGGSNATVYAVHEFGSPSKNIPERSSLRSTIDGHARQYTELSKHLCGMVMDNRLSPKQAHGILGERVLADIKRTIQRGVPPPLKDATVARKGSSKQLIDTVQLLNSITYEVRRV